MSMMDNFQSYTAHAPLLAFVAAFLGGIAASLTPCVYPMIPITVAYIGGRSAGSRGHAFLLSVCYVLGMAVTYAALGAVAALTGKLFGRLATNPVTFVVLGALFVAMGLNMLDLFTLPMPQWLSNARPGRERGGFAGAFVIGLFAGLAVGPCTAPLLAAILGFVATRHNVAFGISLLFTFAMGMGMLFLVVGSSAGVLMSLPKSGQWMVRVKQIFGGILILFGIFFLYQAVQRWM
jgi:thiol:disulfide interchange protein